MYGHQTHKRLNMLSITLVRGDIILLLLRVLCVRVRGLCGSRWRRGLFDRMRQNALNSSKKEKMLVVEKRMVFFVVVRRNCIV